MEAEAIAELDAEDLALSRCADKPVEYYTRFSRTPAEDFYKKPILCSAHVVGVGFGAFNRQQAQEVANKELKRMRAEQTMRDGPEVGESVMDRAAAQLILTRAQTGRTTSECDVEFFLEHMDRRVGGECSDLETPAEKLHNAQGKLAFERARFRADCAARAIRTAADAEKHKCRIAVARADVVRRKKKYYLCM